MPACWHRLLGYRYVSAMQLARVIGTVVATQSTAFEGPNLLLVQLLTLDDKPRGPPSRRRRARSESRKVLVVMRLRGRGSEALGASRAVDALSSIVDRYI